MLYSGAELNAIFETELASNLTIKGVSIDTRTLQPGELFIAIKGRQMDGHDYVPQAVATGAAAVIIEHPMPDLAVPQIVVDDALKAMQCLGEYARRRSKARVIAVTGSVGKTTSKELLTHCLSAFGKSQCSQASYNNHWGVPLSLARLEADTEYAVFEIGMNNPGEIAPLVAMAKPDIAIITNIAPAHIGQMGSLQAIAEEKASIYNGLNAGGQAIMPAQSEYLDLLIKQAQLYTDEQPLIFGESDNCFIQLVNYHQQEGQAKVTVKVGEETLSFTLARLGRHIACNALIAFAVAACLDLDKSVIVRQLATLPQVPRRGQLFELTIDDKKITIIDDSYNANLVSMMNGIELLTAIDPKAGGRRVAVIGEMLELGDVAEVHHQLVGQALSEHPIDVVYLVGGSNMQACYASVTPLKRKNFVSKAQELVSILLKDIQDNDVLLFKGSNGIKLNVILDALKEHAEQQSNASVA